MRKEILSVASFIGKTGALALTIMLFDYLIILIFFNF
jgi:hypothetical protein